MDMIYKYGIDYGTTNSSIALSIVKNGKIITSVIDVEEIMPQKSTPSKVLLKRDGSLVSGRQETKSEDRHRILRAVKMVIDPDSEFFDESFLIKVGNEHVHATDAISTVLSNLRLKADEVSQTFGITVSGVVMGVPVGFGDKQKFLLKNALVKAGFYKTYEDADKLTEFVSEPLAVAVDYAEKITEDKNVLVFDFGGGTLDIAIMNLKRNIAMNEKLHPHEVLAKSRKTIGGENLNEYFFVNCFCSSHSYGLQYFKKVFNINNPVNARQLWEMLSNGECGMPGLDFVDSLEELKCALSKKQVRDFYLKSGPVTIEKKSILRTEFEEAIKTPFPGERLSAFDQITEAVTSTIEKAGIDVETELDTILTAGGSSLIPCVREFLYDQFPEQLHRDSGKIEKMTCIASGLSIVGCREKSIIEDMLDKDYGFWDVNNKEFIPVLEKGTPIQSLYFNKIQKNGVCKTFRKADPSVKRMNIDIYERTMGTGENGKRLFSIQIGNTTSVNFTIYMTVDKKQDILRVYLFDEDTEMWLDNQGLVSAKMCEYKIK